MKSKQNTLIPLLFMLGMLASLAGCGINPGEGAIRLQSLGPAPELENDVWINTDQPLRLADLRGKVVLLEMWTFG